MLAHLLTLILKLFKQGGVVLVIDLFNSKFYVRDLDNIILFLLLDSI